MQTDLWYDLELRELVGGSTAEDLIRDAEAAQFSVDESDGGETDGERSDGDKSDGEDPDSKEPGT